jgi:Asparagine synthase
VARRRPPLPHRAVRGVHKTFGDRLSPYSTQLTELELASEIVLGEDADAPPLPEVDPAVEPLVALSQAMIPYLERPPCLVSFSGGRDSSIVLAVATAVARREGLEAPIPITYRFPAAPETDESNWQELVIRHVCPPDWILQAFTDEFDFIGPLAREGLLRHGVTYPPAAFDRLPMLREARDGTLLMGLGGDELLRSWRWVRTASVLAGRVRPAPRDVLRLGAAVAPARVRSSALRRIVPLDLPWLRPDAAEAVKQMFYSYLAAEPFRWDERTRWRARRRDISVAVRGFDLVAEGTGAAIAHPLLAPRFLATLARAGGSLGFGGLADVMRAHFGSVLPKELIARPSKTYFDDVFWGPHSREFMRTWAAESVPIEFVDRRGLLETWRQGKLLGATVLQALWLAAHRTSEGARPACGQVDRPAFRG